MKFANIFPAILVTATTIKINEFKVKADQIGGKCADLGQTQQQAPECAQTVDQLPNQEPIGPAQGDTCELAPVEKQKLVQALKFLLGDLNQQSVQGIQRGDIELAQRLKQMQGALVYFSANAGCPLFSSNQGRLTGRPGVLSRREESPKEQPSEEEIQKLKTAMIVIYGVVSEEMKSAQKAENQATYQQLQEVKKALEYIADKTQIDLKAQNNSYGDSSGSAEGKKLSKRNFGYFGGYPFGRYYGQGYYGGYPFGRYYGQGYYGGNPVGAYYGGYGLWGASRRAQIVGMANMQTTPWMRDAYLAQW